LSLTGLRCSATPPTPSPQTSGRAPAWRWRTPSPWRSIGGQADVVAALAAYDQARRARTQRLVRASWTAGRIAQWRNPLAAGLRDTLAWLLPPNAYLRSMTDTLAWTPPVRVVDR
jgi:hypothetical protein